MLRFFLWFFAVIGVLAIALVSLGVYGVVHLRNKAPEIAETTVLRFDFERPVTEAAASGGLGRLVGDRPLSFTDTINAIRHGAEDSRVKGMVARTGDISLGLAQVQELRDAIAAFRAKGKFAYAYAETFGDLTGGTRAYYLASAFDEIWLQPVGALALTGISAELPFFRGSLDKLGITPAFDRRAEYKSAMTQFTDTKLPDTDREAFNGMVKSVFDQTAQGIADGRKLTVGDVRGLIDGGPYMTEEALAKHLVDHIGYSDEAMNTARRKAGDGARLMNGLQYEQAMKRGAPSGPVIAVIRAIGEIKSGRAPDSPFGQNETIGSDDLVKAIDQASRDSVVRAIVLRIDSPGGSATASETIWRAVKRARDLGKPVVVSMGDTAASGGYYIATPADKIVAEPGTLTGSIGVFSGKFVTSGLWDKLGVSWEEIEQGHNAGIGSSNHDFTPEQRDQFEHSLDQVYNAFMAHVAEGRKLDPAKVAAIAKGRVWTGAEAKENGLVDELGGFDVAVRLAREAGHITTDQSVILRPYPTPKSTIQKLLAGLSDEDSGSDGMQLGTSIDRLAALAPLLRQFDLVTRATENSSGTRAAMQPVELTP